MEAQNSPEREVKLLIEDYGTRTRQWREEAESPAGGDNGPATPPPSSSPPPFSSEAPVTQPPAFSLLLDDYDARSARWWAGFDRSASREPAGPAVPTDLPGPRLLIEDYVPGSFSEWWKPQADRGSVSDIAALGTTAVSASEPPALPVSGTDGDLALDVEWDQRLRHPRTRAAAVGSLIVHTVSVALLLFPRALVQMPRDLREPPPSPVISLLAPPGSVLRELTQPAPTEGPPTLEFEGPKETAAPTIVFPEEPKAEPPSPPPEPDPPPEPEPPQIEVEPKPPEPEQQPPDPILAPPAAQSPNPGDFRPGARLSKKQSPDELPMPRRPSRPVERPKLALQNPTTASPGREGPLELGSLGLNARPGQIVRGAIQNLSRGGGTPAKQAVGDTLGAGGLGRLFASVHGQYGKQSRAVE